MMIGGDNDGQMIFGDRRDLKLPDICLTDEEKPRKNLTQEAYPDWGLNMDPLCDRHACHHLAHSGGLQVPVQDRIFLFQFYIWPTDGLDLKPKFPIYKKYSI